jgi:hypothetical protein
MRTNNTALNLGLLLKCYYVLLNYEMAWELDRLFILCCYAFVFVIILSQTSYFRNNVCFLTFKGPCCIANVFSSITNKMQRYTIRLFLQNVLHVSGGSCAHHQELKTVYTASGICEAGTASCRGGAGTLEFQLLHDSER